MTPESLFVVEADGLEPTEYAIGPWSPDTLQGSAYCGACEQTLLFERRQ